MLIARRVILLLALGLCWSTAASGQQVQPTNQQVANSIHLDVVVASKNGAPVAGLAQQDFTLLDNGVAQAISSFRAVGGREAHVEVVVVFDAVNARAETVAYERNQVGKLFRANRGLLPYPATFAVSTEAGVQFHPDVTTDGNALAAALNDATIPLRTLNQGQSKSDCGQGDCTDGGFEIGSRMLSLKALETIAVYASARPGRKLVLWISPGWPLLSNPSANLRMTSLQQKKMFARMVNQSTQIQQARMTLYSVDPSATRDVSVRDFSYQAYLKGVRNIRELQPGNLGLQVFAVHSGGLALSTGNDLAELLQKCLADTESYYEISFQSSAASAPDEYHGLEIRLAKPGLKARTLASYYAQLSSATNNSSLTSPSQAQLDENEP